MPEVETDPELEELLNEMAAEEKPPKPKLVEASYEPEQELEEEEPIRLLDLGETTVMKKEERVLPFVDLAHQFGKTVNTILQNCESDRQQLEEIVVFASGEARSWDGDRPSAALLEAWVAATSKKADVNIGATKLLDSIAKLLAAGKNNELLQDGAEEIGGSDIDFDKLLGQDRYFDENK